MDSATNQNIPEIPDVVLRFFLSADGTLDARDIVLGEVQVGALRVIETDEANNIDVFGPLP